LSPNLNIGIINEVFHADGKVPDFNDTLKSVVSEKTHFFNTIGGISSGPHEESFFNPHSASKTSS
jgi:hypothetical protein